MSDEKKRVPKLRFPEFTEEWEQRKLDTITDVRDGTHDSPQYVEIGHPFITSKNVKDGFINYEDIQYVSDKDYEEINKRSKVDKNDILMGMIGTIGNIALVRETPDFAIKNVALIKDIGDVYYRYLYHCLQSNSIAHQLDENLDGGTQKFIALNKIRELVIPVPSDYEQHKIGDYMESLDNLITLHQHRLKHWEKMKKGLLQNMFPKKGETCPQIRFPSFNDDWEQRKLESLVIDHNAGVYIRKEDYGSGTNVIGVGNIYDNDIFDGEIYRLGPVNDDKFLLEENDLIYGESSLVPEGIARTVCVGKNGAGSAFAWHTRRVKLDQNIVDSHFATLELNYNVSIRKYLMSVSTQTALTGMTTEGYFGATLVLPSVKEQAVISEFFKNLDHLITLHQRKLKHLQKLKKGLLQQMFI